MPVLVVESAGSGTDDTSFFMQLVEKYVPKMERPARVIFLGHFLETPGGKVSRETTLSLISTGG